MFLVLAVIFLSVVCVGVFVAVRVHNESGIELDELERMPINVHITVEDKHEWLAQWRERRLLETPAECQPDTFRVSA